MDGLAFALGVLFLDAVLKRKPEIEHLPGLGFSNRVQLQGLAHGPLWHPQARC